MEPGRFSSSYRYTESTKITVQPRSSSEPAAARCAPRPKSSFGSFSVWGGDNGKESLSRPEKVTERQIDGGKVYTVAGLSKLGDRSIDIYVTQSGKVHHSSPGNRLVHYGTGDEIKELKPGEDRIEKSEVDKEFYYLSKGQSKLLQRGKVYGAAGSIPDCYVSPQGKLIKAGAGARLFQIGAEKELVEYKPDSKGYQHIISKKKEHFIVTPKGPFPLKPGTVQPGAVNSPAVYLSENGELTVASDIRSRLFKLGAEDEAVEFNSSEAAFKYVVSKRQTPFLITSKGVCTLKPESFYRAQDGRPDMYISADCVLTRASDTTSRLVKLCDEDEAVEYEPNLSNFNVKISQSGRPYCVTSSGATPLKPGSLYPAQGIKPAFYISRACELTTASSKDARLFKLGGEDQAVEYKKDAKGFNYVVSKQKSPFLVTTEGVRPLTYDQTVTLKLPTGRQLEITAKRGKELQHKFIN